MNGCSPLTHEEVPAHSRCFPFGGCSALHYPDYFAGPVSIVQQLPNQLNDQLNERILLFSHTPELNRYLAFSSYIDGDHPAVASLARTLAAGCTSEEAVVQNCFEFVRDKIRHSWDFKLNPVTCRASDVLIRRLQKIFLILN